MSGLAGRTPTRASPTQPSKPGPIFSRSRRKRVCIKLGNGATMYVSPRLADRLKRNSLNQDHSAPVSPESPKTPAHSETPAQSPGLFGLSFQEHNSGSVEMLNETPKKANSKKSKIDTNGTWPKKKRGRLSSLRAAFEPIFGRNNKEKITDSSNGGKNELHSAHSEESILDVVASSEKPSSGKRRKSRKDRFSEPILLNVTKTESATRHEEQGTVSRTDPLELFDLPETMRNKAYWELGRDWSRNEDDYIDTTGGTDISDNTADSTIYTVNGDDSVCSNNTYDSGPHPALLPVNDTKSTVCIHTTDISTNCSPFVNPQGSPLPRHKFSTNIVPILEMGESQDETGVFVNVPEDNQCNSVLQSKHLDIKSNNSDKLSVVPSSSQSSLEIKLPETRDHVEMNGYHYPSSPELTSPVIMLMRQESEMSSTSSDGSRSSTRQHLFEKQKNKSVKKERILETGVKKRLRDSRSEPNLSTSTTNDDLPVVTISNPDGYHSDGMDYHSNDDECSGSFLYKYTSQEPPASPLRITPQVQKQLYKFTDDGLIIEPQDIDPSHNKLPEYLKLHLSDNGADSSDVLSDVMPESPRTGAAWISHVFRDKVNRRRGK